MVIVSVVHIFWASFCDLIGGSRASIQRSSCFPSSPTEESSFKAFRVLHKDSIMKAYGSVETSRGQAINSKEKLKDRNLIS